MVELPSAPSSKSQIDPEELPRWVPGQTLLSSDGLGWQGVTLRGYRYTGLDVEVPALRDYMIVAYCQGITPMSRQFDGHWSREHCVPGDVSLLTRSEKSHWHWTDDIDVIHIYLSPQLLTKVSSQALEREVADVRLKDVLKVHDPVIAGAARAIAAESTHQDHGGQLYVEAVATQMAIHLLRQYSALSFRAPHKAPGLSTRQAKQIVEYIDSRLDAALTLEELSAVVHLSPWHFLRQFRTRFDCAPHAYVIRRRIEQARHHLLQGRRPLKEIAALCGFADQAHMTRLFRRQYGVTPAALRAAHGT